MKTILAIDLGKSKSVFCKMDTTVLKPRFSTLKTSPQKFHDVFAELDQQNSIVLFEVGAQSGWLSDMLRLLGIDFKTANVNHPSWKWSKNRKKTAIIAVARHMLMRCWAMLRDNKSWQYKVATATVKP